MESRLLRRSLPFAAVALAVVAVQWLPPGGAAAPPVSSGIAVGDPDAVRAAYDGWSEAHRRAGGDRRFVVRLGWSKALSAARSSASGTARFDLVAGRVVIDAQGLEEGADVWLVDNRDVPGGSAAPEPHDRYLRLGALRPHEGDARLAADLGPAAFRSFDVDLVVVSLAGRPPSEAGVLFGMPTLFQRLYRRGERLQAGLPEVAGEPGASKPAPAEAFLTFFRPVVRAHAGDFLVDQGRRLFVSETFGGNGRTCASCHPPANNFTIDPTFIASLPPRDPLFVAEHRPELSDLENPALMRQVGLILENVDGFDRPGVMRSVPHTLALRTSLTPATFDQSTTPPNQRTGWGGDGAPGGGTLREFAVGAVTQHFPRTLARVNGVDFRLPTDAELDAMEAFQLSLGRQADLDLSTLDFRSPVVQLGKRIFNNGGASPDPSIARGNCALCHVNGGSNVSSGANANFDTGVENLPAQPADLVDPDNNPPDAGFGQAPHPGGGFGTGRFNTPPGIEAADTGPFFHNNAVETIEEAVNFYNSDAFRESPAGQSATTGNINMAATEVVAVAAFLRVINADENIRQSTEEARRALGRSWSESQAHLRQSMEELTDAIEVVRGGRLHPAAVNDLVAAFGLKSLAFVQPFGGARDGLIRQAIQKMAAARADMVQ